MMGDGRRRSDGIGEAARGRGAGALELEIGLGGRVERLFFISPVPVRLTYDLFLDCGLIS